MARYGTTAKATGYVVKSEEGSNSTDNVTKDDAGEEDAFATEVGVEMKPSIWSDNIAPTPLYYGCLSADSDILVACDSNIAGNKSVIVTGGTSGTVKSAKSKNHTAAIQIVSELSSSAMESVDAFLEEIFSLDSRFGGSVSESFQKNVKSNRDKQQMPQNATTSKKPKNKLSTTSTPTVASSDLSFAENSGTPTSPTKKMAQNATVSKPKNKPKPSATSTPTTAASSDLSFTSRNNRSHENSGTPTSPTKDMPQKETASKPKDIPESSVTSTPQTAFSGPDLTFDSRNNKRHENSGTPSFPTKQMPLNVENKTQSKEVLVTDEKVKTTIRTPLSLSRNRKRNLGSNSNVAVQLPGTSSSIGEKPPLTKNNDSDSPFKLSSLPTNSSNKQSPKRLKEEQNQEQGSKDIVASLSTSSSTRNKRSPSLVIGEKKPKLIKSILYPAMAQASLSSDTDSDDDIPLNLAPDAMLAKYFNSVNKEIKALKSASAKSRSSPNGKSQKKT